MKDVGGYIDLQSTEKEGSTFTLYFPVTREEVTVDRKALSPESYRGNGESILVIDDIREQRELAMQMLERLGYKVAAVASGEEAVAYLRGNRADLLVLDMIMDPGIDGMETYRRVLEIEPRQKAIIVSGYSETDRVRETLKFGAGAYVRKTLSHGEDRPGRQRRAQEGPERTGLSRSWVSFPPPLPRRSFLLLLRRQYPSTPSFRRKPESRMTYIGCRIEVCPDPSRGPAWYS